MSFAIAGAAQLTLRIAFPYFPKYGNKSSRRHRNARNSKLPWRTPRGMVPAIRHEDAAIGTHMIVNRIRELREQKDMTIEQLAEAVGSSIGTIQRLEQSDVRLAHRLLEPIANELGVPWPMLLGLTESVPAPGLAESAKPFVSKPGDALDVSRLGEHDAPFEVRDDSLSALGIRAGDVLIFDISAKAVRDVATGDVVVIQAYGETLAATLTMVRQFVGPALLITNRRRGPQHVLNSDEDDVAIKGVARQRWGTLRLR